MSIDSLTFKRRPPKDGDKVAALADDLPHEAVQTQDWQSVKDEACLAADLEVDRTVGIARAE